MPAVQGEIVAREASPRNRAGDKDAGRCDMHLAGPFLHQTVNGQNSMNECLYITNLCMPLSVVG